MLTGIYLVLATQLPDANTFSGLLRSNIPGRIALRVQKAVESRIILDEIGAEKLLGKGDMLVKTPPYNQSQYERMGRMSAEMIFKLLSATLTEVNHVCHYDYL